MKLTKIERSASRFLIISLFAFLPLITAVCFSPISVIAMGQPPTDCQNRYPSAFTSFEVSNQSGFNYNVFASANSTIDVPVGGGYNLTFTLLTGSNSTTGNTQNGTTWYEENAYGYYNGECLGGANPDTNITFSQNVSDVQAQPAVLGGYQEVNFSALSSSANDSIPDNSVSFWVYWYHQNSTTNTVLTSIATTTETNTTTGNSTSAPLSSNSQSVFSTNSYTFSVSSVIKSPASNTSGSTLSSSSPPNGSTTSTNTPSSTSNSTSTNSVFGVSLPSYGQVTAIGLAAAGTVATGSAWMYVKNKHRNQAHHQA